MTDTTDSQAADKSLEPPSDIELSTTSSKEDLAFTQGIRKSLLKSYKGIPEDKSDKTFMLGLLDGMDRQALAIERMKVDDGIADKQANAAATISSLIAKGIIPDAQVPGSGAIPTLPEGLPEPVLVNGELDVNTGANAAEMQPLNYRTFIAEANEKNLSAEGN